jgi:hypothetical protein
MLSPNLGSWTERGDWYQEGGKAKSSRQYPPLVPMSNYLLQSRSPDLELLAKVNEGKVLGETSTRQVHFEAVGVCYSAIGSWVPHTPRADQGFGAFAYPQAGQTHLGI